MTDTPTDEPERTREVVLVFRPRKILAAAGIGVAVILVLLLGLQWRRESNRADDLAGQRDDRQAAALVASDFVQSYLLRDSTNPTAGLDHLKSLATSEYAPKLDARPTSPIDPSTSTSQPQTEVKSSAEVQSVYIADASGDRAHAVCVVMWSLTTGGQTTPLSQLYMEVDLQREGGTWKVNDLPAIGLRQEGGTTTSSPTSTPTSTPTTSAPGG